MERADGLAAFFVGEFRYAAGVDYNEVGCLAAADAPHALVGEEPGDA